MARTKNYIEEEVIEKAMNLFWRNGYEATSTRMLEKEMGINQFSIYASFKNKQGVYIESIKCYRNKLKDISDKLKASNSPAEGIKSYFYEFIGFSCDKQQQIGCLVINTFTELGKHGDPAIMKEANLVANDIRNLFVKNLRLDSSKDEETIEKQANYLIIAMTGLATASKVFDAEQIADYIDTIFKNI